MRTATTFREAATDYLEWARKNKMKQTPRSRAFWNRREQVLQRHVIPSIGDRPMSEISRIMILSLQDTISAIIQRASSRDRDDAMAAATAVLEHHYTGR